jgi:hypothetical protein
MDTPLSRQAPLSQKLERVFAVKAVFESHSRSDFSLAAERRNQMVVCAINSSVTRQKRTTGPCHGKTQLYLALLLSASERIIAMPFCLKVFVHLDGTYRSSQAHGRHYRSTTRACCRIAMRPHEFHWPAGWHATSRLSYCTQKTALFMLPSGIILLPRASL